MIKTQKDLRNELVQAAECWWMDAAAKTIIEAGLQKRFASHLAEIAHKHGHADLEAELQQKTQMQELATAAMPRVNAH